MRNLKKNLHIIWQPPTSRHPPLPPNLPYPPFLANILRLPFPSVLKKLNPAPHLWRMGGSNYVIASFLLSTQQIQERARVSGKNRVRSRAQLYWKIISKTILLGPSAGEGQSGPFRKYGTRVWQNAHIKKVWSALVCDVFFFLRNFIKGILCTCTVFPKKLKRLLFKLVQIFTTFNRTDVSFFKKALE